MVLPSVTRVKELTRKLVLEANERNVLHTLTPKLLRREIETELELVEGDLDSSELKDAVKETIAATMAEVGEKAETQAAPKSPGKNAGKGKKRSSVSSEELPKKKPRIAQKKKDDKPTDKKMTKGKGSASKPVASPEPKSTKDEDRKDNENAKKSDTGTVVEDSPDSGSEQVVKPKSDSVKPTSPKVDVVISNAAEEPPAVSQKDDDKAGYKSESELSVLIDEEPPKKSRNSKSKKDNSSASSSGLKNTKSRKIENMSKDEETIKKLKSLILACGVRKVWSKVFKGVDTPSQQIKMLKETLHELGMTGRMSLEQAKAIKAKRELAQELQDVQEFEKAVTKSKRQPQVNEDEGIDESDDEEEEEIPKQRRRRMNAAQSISAFLGDQSSDED